MPSVLRIENLEKRYGRAVAVRNLSLTIEPGQVYGLLGPNGSGKTTTLAVVLGVVRATKGQWFWFDRPPTAALRRKVGSLLEQPNFFPWLTGWQNLTVVAAVRGVATQAIEASLKTVSLWEHRHGRFGEYSLGMKQRLALASALLGSPDVLVLDEPTNGVDAQGIAEIRSMIRGVASQGKTIILASHILDEVEKVCSHVAILERGAIVDAGPIATVLGGSDILELGGPKLDDILAALGTLPGITSATRVDQRIEATLKPEATAGEVNRLLVMKGLELDHVARRKRSLESRFLEIVGNQNAAPPPR